MDADADHGRAPRDPSARPRAAGCRCTDRHTWSAAPLGFRPRHEAVSMLLSIVISPTRHGPLVRRRRPEVAEAAAGEAVRDESRCRAGADLRRYAYLRSCRAQ